MASLFLIIGIALLIIGGLLILVAAFQESVLWGLACFIFPIVQLFFVITHWREAKTGFLVQIAGFVGLLLHQFFLPTASS